LTQPAQTPVNEAVTPQFGFGVRLRDTTLDQARTEVVDALAEEGFGVLTEIDMGATLKRRLGVDVPPYLILGACNPTLAREALATEPYAGLLLPCNVTLWQEGNEIVVTSVSPRAMFQIVGDERLTLVVEEAERRLRGALERLVE
jgi:uncharacterized protein (DUF302 family)